MGKAQRLKNQKPKPVGDPFILQLLSNGDVSVSGPADMNPAGIMDIFSKALKGLADHHRKKLQSKNRILQPNFKIPGLH